VEQQVAVVGAKKDQNEEEGSGAYVFVRAVVADRHAESVESVSDSQVPGVDSPYSPM